MSWISFVSLSLILSKSIRIADGLRLNACSYAAIVRCKNRIVKSILEFEQRLLAGMGLGWIRLKFGRTMLLVILIFHSMGFEDLGEFNK